MKKFKCGHSFDCDLDTICPICVDSFMRYYKKFVFLLITSVLLFIYFIVSPSYATLFVPLFILLALLHIAIVLRNRKKELLIAFLLVIPTMILTLMEVADNNNFVNTFLFDVEIFTTVSSIIIAVPILFILILGIRDASNIQTIKHKGSLWVVILFTIFAFLTFAYHIIQSILSIVHIPVDQSNIINPTIINQFYFVGSNILFILIIAVFLISIIKALSSKFLRKKTELPKYSAKNKNIIFVSLQGILNILIASYQAVKIGFYFVSQLVSKIFIELWQFFKDIVRRLCLMISRIIRAILIVSMTIIFTFSFYRLAEYTDVIWNSKTIFIFDDNFEWLILISILFVFCLSFSLLEFALINKWEKVDDHKMSIYTFFKTLIGTDTLIHIRSLLLSFIIYSFLILLSFFVVWTIIHFTDLKNGRLTFGIIYIATFPIIAVFIIVAKYLRKKNEICE